jgi:hypothetical protein
LPKTILCQVRLRGSFFIFSQSLDPDKRFDINHVPAHWAILILSFSRARLIATPYARFTAISRIDGMIIVRSQEKSSLDGRTE